MCVFVCVERHRKSGAISANGNSNVKFYFINDNERNGKMDGKRVIGTSKGNKNRSIKNLEEKDQEIEKMEDKLWE